MSEILTIRILSQKHPLDLCYLSVSVTKTRYPTTRVAIKAGLTNFPRIQPSNLLLN